MAEYIDREAVYLKSCKGCTRHGIEVGSCFSDEPCGDLICGFATAPAADVAPVVHARWELYMPYIEFNSNNKTKKPRCSNCKQDASPFRTKFCSNCGAKMDQEDAAHE